MVRVLQITDKGPKGGGIRQVVETHCDLLAARNCSCTRLYLGSQANADTYNAPTKVARHLPENDPALVALRAAAQDVDVIHLHLGFLSLSPDFVSTAARLAPLVTNLHDISPFEDPPRQVTPLRDRLSQRILRPVRRALWQQICTLSSRIITPSHYLAERAIAAGVSPSKITILPHPLAHCAQKQSPPSQHPPTILYAGLLAEEKGASLLLEAFSLIKAPTARLVYMGDGPQTDALVSRANHLGLSDRVKFTGQVAPAAVYQQMADMRVLAHPSLIAEGFGLVGIEAMQHGRPVVGFGTGGAVDWLIHEQTGLIAAPQTAQGLANALDRILADADLADRLGAQARDFVEKTFSRQTIGDKLMAIMTQPCGGATEAAR